MGRTRDGACFRCLEIRAQRFNKRRGALYLCSLHFGPQNFPLLSPALNMTSTDDRGILLMLYRLTVGANWKKRTNWGTGAALSDWHGVKINDEGRVIELSLRDNNLRGIPPFFPICGHILHAVYA